METSKSSLRKVFKYIWSFIQPWEYFTSTDYGYKDDKTVTLYWKKHKRKGVFVIYKGNIT